MRTLTLEGLLKTKQSARAKDQLDRVILERALNAGKPVDAKRPARLRANAVRPGTGTALDSRLR